MANYKWGPPSTTDDGSLFLKQWPYAGTKASGTNPRALGTNERAQARNKWALRNWKRGQRRKQGQG
jgi:hypothetical protein